MSEYPVRAVTSAPCLSASAPRRSAALTDTDSVLPSGETLSTTPMTDSAFAYFTSTMSSSVGGSDAVFSAFLSRFMTTVNSPSTFAALVSAAADVNPFATFQRVTSRLSLNSSAAPDAQSSSTSRRW